MKVLRILILLSTLYIVLMTVKWEYETKVIVSTLLNDVLEYDTQLLGKIEKLYNAGKINDVIIYAKLTIPTEHFTINVWFEHWNPFDWGEAKYFIPEFRETTLRNLNYWRNTGRFLYYDKENQIFSV